MKPAHQEQVNFIAGLLRSGTRYTEVLAQFGTKWHSIPKRTFDRRYKDAEATVQGEQQRIREQAEEKVASKVAERETQLMTAQERMELLEKIAKGEVTVKRPFVIGGKIMEYNAQPDHADRTKAIAELNKMCGDYAPTKTDVQLTQTPTIILPGSE